MDAAENLRRARETLKGALRSRPEFLRLDRYAKLLDEAKQLAEARLLPAALDNAGKMYEAWRLERVAWLIAGCRGESGAECRLRLRANHLPMLLACMGEHPRGPRPPAARKSFHEVLDRIEGEPEMPVEITDDYDDVCLACLDMTADGCAKPAAGRDADLRACGALSEILGIATGTVVPAGELLDLVARAIEDASPWIGAANAARYRRGRAVWIARRRTAGGKAT
ncbi:MAG: hypothetical protein N3A38_13280 [Planctomycetota bacterium]|nr:hypothetical protein [Planctomycetota bacterium]